MATLAYKMDGAGGVVLTLTDTSGVRLSARVSENYAKARAWAILSDLDPAEVEATAVVACDPRSVTDEEIAAAVVNIPQGGMTVKDRALLEVAKGSITALLVAQRLGVDRTAVSPRLAEWAKSGHLVVLQSGGGRGGQTFYGLTREGVIRAQRLGLPLEQFGPVPTVAGCL